VWRLGFLRLFGVLGFFCLVLVIVLLSFFICFYMVLFDCLFWLLVFVGLLIIGFVDFCFGVYGVLIWCFELFLQIVIVLL